MIFVIFACELVYLYCVTSNFTSTFDKIQHCALRRRGSAEGQKVQIMVSHCKDPACYCLDVHPLSIIHKLGGKSSCFGEQRTNWGGCHRGEEWLGSRDTERWCLILTKTSFVWALQCEAFATLHVTSWVQRKNNSHFLAILQTTAFLSSKAFKEKTCELEFDISLTFQTALLSVVL